MLKIYIIELESYETIDSNLYSHIIHTLYQFRKSYISLISDIKKFDPYTFDVIFSGTPEIAKFNEDYMNKIHRKITYIEEKIKNKAFEENEKYNIYIS